MDEPLRSPRDGGWRAWTPRLLVAAILLTSIGLSLSYWPGVMTWDSIRQYDQALSGAFDDWHPPLMEWVWRQLHLLMAGPGPMLLLQLAFYLLGFGLLAGWALRRGRPRLAIAIAAASLAPVSVALMGTIIKDSLMAAMLLAAAGLLAWRGGRRDRAVRLAAAVLIVLACALRFNAFLAGGPMLTALLPQRLRRTPLRTLVVGALVSAALLLPVPLSSRLLGAEPSGVGLSLVIFDLGGITENSGRDAFPPLAVKDPVAANHRCYSAVKWDLYADWAEEPCPVGFQPVRAAFRRQDARPTLFWVKAILAHPLAYAQHRLTHFNINSRFLVRGEVDRPVRNRTEENDWGLQVTPNPVLDGVDALALKTATTPLGWPIFWIAVALGLVVVAHRLPSRRLVLPLALSALLYGLGYGVVSVSSELRYHFWTMTAALLAALIAAADLPACRDRIRRREWMWAAAPAGLVLIAGAAWRLWPMAG